MGAAECHEWSSILSRSFKQTCLSSDFVQAISESVLRLAGRGASASSMLPLLQLAGTVSDVAVRAQLQAAVLDALLPESPLSTSAEQLLQRISAFLPHCSTEQVQQLRSAVQATLARGIGGWWARAGAAAAVSEAVQLCFHRLHAAAGGQTSSPQAEPVAAAGQQASTAQYGAAGSSTLQLQNSFEVAAAGLFILGPFSSTDLPTCLAEASLLLSSLSGPATTTSSPMRSSDSLCWLLAALATAFSQLHSFDRESSPPSLTDAPPCWQQHPAGAALLLDAPSALHALLLSAAGGCPAARSAAIGAVLAVPPWAQAPLCLLRRLVDTCGKHSMPSTTELSVSADGARLAHMQAQGSGNEAEAESDRGGSAEHAPNVPVQQRALLSLLELLGAMSAEYERQRAAFQLRLAAKAGQQGDAAALQQGQQPQHGISKAKRPLRPASEWWVGKGQGQPGAGGDEDQQSGLGSPSSAHAVAAAGTTPAEAAAGGAGGTSFDYMRGEDQAAKQEAAAQRFMDSLLAAADTPPACFLPLLEWLAGGGCSEEGRPAATMPSCVQARPAGADTCLSVDT